jgi:vesicle transport through interaction with t-SNAREs protein 1
LTQADGSIDRASGTLKKMIYKYVPTRPFPRSHVGLWCTADSDRMYQQKFVTYAIIAVLVLLILLVLYSKLFG